MNFVKPQLFPIVYFNLWLFGEEQVLNSIAQNTIIYQQNTKIWKLGRWGRDTTPQTQLSATKSSHNRTGNEVSLTFFITAVGPLHHHYAGVQQYFVSTDLKLKTTFLERVTFLKTHKILHSLLTFTILRIEPIKPWQAIAGLDQGS